MNEQQVKNWLTKHGFLTSTRSVEGALRAFQRVAKDAGLYAKNIDGIFGKGTQAAMDAYDKGVRSFKNHGLKFNIYNPEQVKDAMVSLAKKGVNNVVIDGKKVNVDEALKSFGVERGSQAFRRVVDSGSIGKLISEITGRPNSSTQTGGGTPNAQASPIGFDELKMLFGGHPITPEKMGAEQHNFKEGSLNDLVKRFAYDMYHSDRSKSRQKFLEDTYGIQYDYKPGSFGNMVSGTKGMTLYIDPKRWTPEQAERIAAGNGEVSYVYGKRPTGAKGFANDVKRFFGGEDSRSQKVNYFAGGQYKDQKDFEDTVMNLYNSGYEQDALNLFNSEMKRQYQKYRINYAVAKNKTPFQWNQVYGTVPYGYHATDMLSIILGKQSEVPYVEGYDASRSGETANRKSFNDRFETSDISDYEGLGRLLFTGYGNEHAHGINESMSPTRAVAASFSKGFPVEEKVAGEITPIDTQPIVNKAGEKRYMFIPTFRQNDPERGTNRNRSWIYDDLSRDPELGYKYLEYIMGPKKNHYTAGFRKIKGHGIHKGHTFDKEMADKLWVAATGKPESEAYHNRKEFKNISNSLVSNVNTRDIWSSLKSFYENAYDENGKLKDYFGYGESGYPYRADSGGYSAKIRPGENGSVVRENTDSWDVNLGSITGNMNTTFTDFLGNEMSGFRVYNKYEAMPGQKLNAKRFGGRFGRGGVIRSRANLLSYITK